MNKNINLSKSHPPKTLTRKTFQQNGKWVENPNKTVVLICECAAKYIKTRESQTSCLRCGQ